MRNHRKYPGLEQEECRLTAQAIGLIELLGNQWPNSKQVRIVEQIVKLLRLSWRACEDPNELVKTLQQAQS